MQRAGAHSCWEKTEVLQEGAPRRRGSGAKPAAGAGAGRQSVGAPDVGLAVSPVCLLIGWLLAASMWCPDRPSGPQKHPGIFSGFVSSAPWRPVREFLYKS